jgi:hypothetical protein
VVLKAATQLKDETAARAILKRLVGKDKVSETDPEILKKLGAILVDITKGNAGLVEIDGGRLVIMGKDGNQIWGDQPAAAAAEADGPKEGEYF